MAFKGHQIEAYHDFVVEQADGGVEELVDAWAARPAGNDGVGPPQQTQLELGGVADRRGAQRSPGAATNQMPRASVRDLDQRQAVRLRSRRVRPSRARRAIDESSHLVAARRLSKAIRRAPNRAEEARIGRLVCGHLIALLEETDKELLASAEGRR